MSTLIEKKNANDITKNDLHLKFLSEVKDGKYSKVFIVTPNNKPRDVDYSYFCPDEQYYYSAT